MELKANDKRFLMVDYAYSIRDKKLPNLEMNDDKLYKKFLKNFNTNGRSRQLYSARTSNSQTCTPPQNFLDAFKGLHESICEETAKTKLQDMSEEQLKAVDCYRDHLRKLLRNPSVSRHLDEDKIKPLKGIANFKFIREMCLLNYNEDKEKYLNGLKNKKEKYKKEIRKK